MRKELVLLLLALLCHLTSAQAQFWQQTSGPHGGFVFSIAIDSSGVVFAGTTSLWSNFGGVLRSLDNGGSWTWTSARQQETNAMVIGPGGTLIVSRLVGMTWGEIVWSTDRGMTWATSSYTAGQVFGFVALQNGDVLAGDIGGNGVYRSTDRGVTWSRTDSGLTSPIVLSLVVSTTGRVLCGTGFIGGQTGGVFQSTDNGHVWFLSGLTGEDIRALTVAPNGSIYAGTWGDKVFRSTDNGNTWTQASLGITTGRIYCLTVTQQRTILAGTVDGGIFRSTDDGRNWVAVSQGMPDLFVESLTSKSSGEVFAGSYGGGIYRSLNDGVSWESLPLINTLVLALAVDRNGGVYAGTHGAVYRTTDAGEHWTRTGLGGISIVALGINPQGHLYAASGGAQLFRSTDGGNKWTQLQVGCDTATNVICFGPEGNTYLGTLGAGVLRSTDNGTTWSRTGLDNVQALTVNSRGDVYAAGYAGVHRSTNRGSSWLTCGLVENVEALGVSSHDAVFAYGGPGLYRSTDDGTTWSLTSNGPAAKLIIDQRDNIYALRNGVCRSTDGGATWDSLTGGLTNWNIQVLAVSSSGHLYAGTWGDGVYRSMETVVSVSEGQPTQAPSNYRLSQNYPNPFNPTTTISFSIPHSTFITLKIYNTLGQNIATLVSDNLTPGTYSKQWNATNVASGVYYYRLQAGDFMQTKKLLLLR